MLRMKKRCDFKASSYVKKRKERKLIVMKNVSNLIKCPKTGDILIYTDLLKGIRTLATNEQIKNHHMHPQSGLIKDVDGGIISIVDLLLDKESNQDRLITIDIVDNNLNLTIDKFQTATLKDSTNIIFPDVENFLEIHLFFEASDDINLVFPENTKWQDELNIEANKYYELVFTHIGDTWLGGAIIYE